MDGKYCKICLKEYSSYKSWWNHHKKFHYNNNLKNNILHHNDTTITNIIQHIDGYNCKYCLKEFSFSQSKYRHEKTCKKNNTIIITEENKSLKTEIFTITKNMDELKTQLKELMNKQYKIHPKTLQKINKQLNVNNSNNNNNNNNNNNICSNNTYNIIQLGQENLDVVLSQKEQLNILNKNFNSLEYMIRYIHFNEKYPQFKNIHITNVQNNIAYRYDTNMNKFIATDKNILVADLISFRTADIEEFLDNNINLLEEKTVTKIKEFINKITYDDNYDVMKRNQIKLLIYNNRDKITKEIYHDLEVIV